MSGRWQFAIDSGRIGVCCYSARRATFHYVADAIGICYFVGIL